AKKVFTLEHSHAYRPVYCLCIMALPRRDYFLFRNVAEIKEEYSTEQAKHDARNVFVMSAHDDHVFGIDVSQYQSDILWDSVHLIHDKFPIDFVFVRATMGTNGKDKKFRANWNALERRSK